MGKKQKEQKLVTAQSFEGFNTAELTDLKLKTEIIKLRSEIDEKSRPWVSKNLAILIPSLIGIGTLLTGYFTGYFSVESKRLENQRHDLVQDITAFTEKKDSLNKKNIDLMNTKEILIAQTSRLKSDSAKLINDLSQMNKRADDLLSEKNRLSNEVITIQTDKRKLETEKENLNQSVNTLRDDVKKAGFKEYLRSILIDPGISTNDYPKLVDIVRNSNEFHEEYINAVTKTIDTTSDFTAKAILLRLMYETTNDVHWRKQLFTLAEKFCDYIKTKEGFFSSYRFWEVYSWNFGKDPDEKVLIIKFLTGLISRLENNPEAIDNVLTEIAFLQSSGSELKLHEKAPLEFCRLVEKSKELSFNNVQVNMGCFYFLRYHAPIAFVCIVSELMKNPDRLPSYRRNQLLGDALEIIDKNSDVLAKPANPASPDSWNQWQQANGDLLKIALNVNEYCNQRNIIEKIIGKRF